MPLESLKNYEPHRYEEAKRLLSRPLDLAFLEILHTSELIDKLRHVDKRTHDDKHLADIRNQLRIIVGYSHYNLFQTMINAELILREEGSRSAIEEANKLAEFSQSFNPKILKAYHTVVKNAAKQLAVKSLPAEASEEARGLLDKAKFHAAQAAGMVENILAQQVPEVRLAVG